MTIIEYILAGTVVALLSVFITKYFNDRSKIDRESCKGIRDDCKTNRILSESLILQKIENLHTVVTRIDNTLTDCINNKLFG